MSAGKSHIHDSACEHVTGQAQYVDDLTPHANQLHVAVGGATIACGKITSIKLDAVRDAPGVVDVLSFDDLPALTDLGPVFPGDPLLVDQHIEYMGQAIFVVAATSTRLARQAVNLAEITYHESAPLLDLQEAIDNQIFVRPSHTMQRGDASAAIASAENRLSGNIRIGGQEHFYLEGQVAKCIPDDNGHVTIYSSNQNPTETQHLIAAVLGVPMNRVTVVTRRMGGGFGGKETQATRGAMICA